MLTLAAVRDVYKRSGNQVFSSIEKDFHHKANQKTYEHTLARALVSMKKPKKKKKPCAKCTTQNLEGKKVHSQRSFDTSRPITALYVCLVVNGQPDKHAPWFLPPFEGGGYRRECSKSKK